MKKKTKKEEKGDNANITHNERDKERNTCQALFYPLSRTTAARVVVSVPCLEFTDSKPF